MMTDDGDEVTHIEVEFTCDQLTDEQAGERDSVIVVIPPQCYRDGRLMLPAAGQGLMRASNRAAEQMGERLHHAHWTITGDREQVKSLGLVHDCPTCVHGVDQATAFLREHPDELVAVGQLWWIKDDG